MLKIVSDASKKVARKKSVAAAKRGGKTPASSKAAAQSVDKVTEAVGDMAISDLNSMGILRDVRKESPSVTFHGHDPIVDSELKYGSPKYTPIPAWKNLSHREITSKNPGRYVPLAEKALEYYNSKEHKNLKLVEVCVAAENDYYVHINFHGCSNDASEKLLFAEFKYSDAEGDTLEVKGCCVLEKVDSGNPLGSYCCICFGEVIHPGPRDGFRIISGDPFKDYKFWDYHPRAYDPFEAVRQFSESTADHQMFHDCAIKAIDYYNFHQDAKFEFVEVTGGAACLYEIEKIIHINFKGKSSFMQEEMLFFAVLSVPLFQLEVSSIWEDFKKSFIQVKGCCQLKLLDSGNPFGRTCGLCYGIRYGRVIHPGHKDGYCMVAGDGFIGSDFMNIGLGIY